MKNRIQQILRHSQLSQKDFAARTGISPATLSQVLAGKQAATIKTVDAIHTAFPEISLDWLMFDKGEMMAALPRFAITGYDQANFFLRGLHQYGKDFKGTKEQNKYIHLQTPLYFKSANATGGMLNAAFMLVHYAKNGNIESINY